MSDHYFSEQPNVPSRPNSWDTELRGQSLKLTSDEGVFSKRGIDPGTKFLVEAFQLPETAGPLLDMGCGYGPIGLSLAKSYPSREVVMVDINERAVKLTGENAGRNGIGNVHVFQSYLFSEVKTDDFAAILSNPPIRTGKKVIYQLFEDAFGYLAAGGEFWTVIRKQQGAASALKELQAIFPEVAVIFKKKGYVVMKGVKLVDSAI